MTTRFPIYILSRGRSQRCLTGKRMLKDGVEFNLVVEPHEASEYRQAFPDAHVIVLPKSHQGVSYARCFTIEHAKDRGNERYWQADDNIRNVYRITPTATKLERTKVSWLAALTSVEDFVDRYENVALAGLRSQAFLQGRTHYVNRMAYCCVLTSTAMKQRWRIAGADDPDINLQVLFGGWCTLLIERYVIDKVKTGVMPGGNTDLYADGGREKVQRALADLWPGLFEIRLRFGRHKPAMNHIWRQFTNEPRLKPGMRHGAL